MLNKQSQKSLFRDLNNQKTNRYLSPISQNITVISYIYKQRKYNI